MNDEPGDALEAAWGKLLEDFADEDAHRRFQALASTLGKLPEAGARYRKVRDDDADPAKKEVARRQIERLLGLAMQSLAVEKSPPRKPQQDRRLLFIAAGITIVMLLYVARIVLGAH